MIYCFECEHCGHRAELNRPAKDYKKKARCPECKKLMRRNIAIEGAGQGAANDNYPMESDAAGVHPDQIKETMAFDRAHGVPTEYKPSGNPVFTSRGHRRAYCEAHGLYDRNAGYGDAAPKNVTQAANRGQSPRVRLAKAAMAGQISMAQFSERTETNGND